MSSVIQINDLAHLVDAVGTGGPDDPKASGLNVINLQLWDGRTVLGSYYNGDKKPDIISEFDIILDDYALELFIRRMLEEGLSFITETGEDDLVCTLKWEIRHPLPN